MAPSIISPFRSRGERSIASAARGMTLVELMVSLTILVITTVGGVSGFIMLNQYASNLRNLSSAKALCQERIEQVQTMVFTPPINVPTVTGQTDGRTYYLLGPGSNSTGQTSVYDASGKFTPTGSLTTSSAEPVQVYVQQDGVTNTVAGTRSTTVALSSLVDGSTGSTNASLKVLTFTVQVSYTYRGKPYTYSMYTLRGPD